MRSVNGCNYDANAPCLRQKRMVGPAHRKGQLPPGSPLEMTCPPSPSLFGIQFPGGGFFDTGRSATRAPTHPAATRSAANSQFRVFLAFWECTFVRFRWSPREGSDSNAKPSPRRGSGEPQKLIWISGRSHSTRLSAIRDAGATFGARVWSPASSCNTVKLGRDGGVAGLLLGLWPPGVVGAFDETPAQAVNRPTCLTPRDHRCDDRLNSPRSDAEIRVPGRGPNRPGGCGKAIG